MEEVLLPVAAGQILPLLIKSKLSLTMIVSVTAAQTPCLAEHKARNLQAHKLVNALNASSFLLYTQYSSGY